MKEYIQQRRKKIPYHIINFLRSIIIKTVCKKKSPGIDKIIHKYLIFIKEASENNRKKNFI